METDEFKQFHFIDELETNTPNVTLGRYTSHTLQADPRRLVFMLARYKFVSKMLNHRNKVLEIGCSDGFGSNIVKQTVGHLTITDFDIRMINEALKYRIDDQICIEQYNFVHEPFEHKQDGIFLLDVLEHIDPTDEDRFLRNIANSLNHDGVCIIGMPSFESQIHASDSSKEGHINCKSGEQFASLMLNYFANCFLFSMNDEVVHTGFSKMAHYLLCIGVSPK